MTSLVVHLSEQASLATVEVAISSITLLISIFACFYKGFSSSKLGFVWLVVLSITHIVGSVCYIAYEVKELDTSYELVYPITSFIGAAPLLLASLSFSQFTGAATTKGVGAVILGLIQFLPVVGFALGVAGGIEQSHGSSNDQTVGKQLLEAASIILLVTMTALVSITAINLSFIRSLRTLAITVSMPFLVVRIIYNIMTAFSDQDMDSGFQFNLPSIAVQIFMRLIMEYAVVLFYLFTGLGALANVGSEVESGEESEFEKPNTVTKRGQPESEITSAPQSNAEEIKTLE